MIQVVQLFFWHIFPSTFAATIGILLVGVLAGQMLYKLRTIVGITTLVSLVLLALVIWAAAAIPALQTAPGVWPPNRPRAYWRGALRATTRS